ncbi:hypothetical protein CNECB9_5080010 [Cupriavidus necator]|uniref:Uncharacterized protein n=1 Tax=Cupriavidus necator TaxID=106590 RepID=A0A1K0JIC7_CUPNE|nr:hypothetical protein CNECB9_5080010 [Cupriavidus necator]
MTGAVILVDRVAAAHALVGTAGGTIEEMTAAMAQVSRFGCVSSHGGGEAASRSSWAEALSAALS